MSSLNDKDINENSLKTSGSEDHYTLEDSDDNRGIVPDNALQKVNPAEAERLTDDHDPHHVVKDHKQFDTSLTQTDK